MEHPAHLACSERLFSRSFPWGGSQWRSEGEGDSEEKRHKAQESQAGGLCSVLLMAYRVSEF